MEQPIQIVLANSALETEALSDGDMRAEMQKHYPGTPYQWYQVVQRAEQIDVQGAIDSLLLVDAHGRWQRES